jgi:arylsulfatase A-like enzyme
VEHKNDDLPGSSFLPLLNGNQLTEDRPVVIFDEYGPTRMIRTQDWKYVARYPDGPNELYDLTNDPGETVNLIADTAHQKTQQVLASELNNWFENYADPQRDGRTEKVYGRGQLDRIRKHTDQPKTFADDYFFTARLYRVAAFILRLFGQK